MNIDFPFHFDHRGRTAATDDDDFVRDLIEQLLLTDRGERVNRPTFGVPLRRRAFKPNSDQEADILDAMIRAALQEFLADYVELQDLNVDPGTDATLTVTLSYYNLLTLDPENPVKQSFATQVPT